MRVAVSVVLCLLLAGCSDKRETAKASIEGITSKLTPEEKNEVGKALLDQLKKETELDAELAAWKLNEGLYNQNMENAETQEERDQLLADYLKALDDKAKEADAIHKKYSN